MIGSYTTGSISLYKKKVFIKKRRFCGYSQRKKIMHKWIEETKHINKNDVVIVVKFDYK